MPEKFASENLPEGRGRSGHSWCWSAVLKVRTSRRNTEVVRYLTAGWKKFVMAKNIERKILSQKNIKIRENFIDCQNFYYTKKLYYYIEFSLIELPSIRWKIFKFYPTYQFLLFEQLMRRTRKLGFGIYNYSSPNLNHKLQKRKACQFIGPNLFSFSIEQINLETLLNVILIKQYF